MGKEPQAGTALHFEGVSKRYRENLPLLDSVSLSVDYGQVVGLFGPSGSGKSTILQIAAVLVSPDSGKVSIDGKPVYPASSRNGIDVSKLRSSTISYVSQDDFLFESLTVEENVFLALELNGSILIPKQREQEVEEILDLLGIKELKERRITDISAGERKRVAIGRSLVTNPKIVVADEPTSSLDLDTTNELLKLIKMKANQDKTAFLLASHDVLEVKSVSDKVYGIKSRMLFSVD